MSRQLKRKRPGVAGVRNVVRGEVKAAVDALSRRWPPAEESIHEARKRLKVARAALRLLRWALGARVYRRENRALRNVARPLGAIRDAAMLIKTFDALARGMRSRRDVVSLRERLVASKHDARRRALGTRTRMNAILRSLRATRDRARTWKLDSDGWSALGPGARRVYRSARQALEEARRDPSPERLHEWRKRTKYLRHVLEFLGPVSPPLMGRREHVAHALSDALGKDHDLSVLAQRLAARRGRVDAAATAIAKLAERGRRRLRSKEMTLGAKLYAVEPRSFERDLKRRWRDWRS
jgi:CHAD domain-containing protein